MALWQIIIIVLFWAFSVFEEADYRAQTERLFGPHRTDEFYMGRRRQMAEAYYQGLAYCVSVPDHRHDPARVGVVLIIWKSRLWHVLKAIDLDKKGPEYWDSVYWEYWHRGEAGGWPRTGELPSLHRRNAAQCAMLHDLLNVVVIGEPE